MNYLNYKIGKENEWFVRDYMDTNNHMSLIRHNDDKRINGILPYHNLLPDLLFQCNLKGKYQYVSLECKRRTHDKYIIDVCKEQQLVRYQNYAKKYPTYIVLCVGGPIYHPSAMYIIPIKYVKTQMTRDELEIYSWDYTRVPFFHTDFGRITY